MTGFYSRKREVAESGMRRSARHGVRVLADIQLNDRAALLHQQDTLTQFGELALRSDDLDEILIEACRLVGEGLHTELAKVMQMQADGATLLVRAGVGWKPGVVGQMTIKVVDGTSEGYALKSGEPMVSPDIATETRFRYPPFLIENGVRAVANVAIIGSQGRQPFGLLQVDSREPRQFTSENISFLRSYANLLAAAVDRLRVIGEVRDAEAELRMALEAGELGSWKLDLASGQVSHTARAMQIFGYADPTQAWNYDIFLTRVLPEDRERVDAIFRTAVNTGAEWSFECRIYRVDDGALCWIEAKGKFGGGRMGQPPTHGIGILADITARKAAEEDLRHTNEVLEARVVDRTHDLTEANALLRAAAKENERVEDALRQSHKMEAVGQLTGGLAHDFNNMLAAISGSLEMIRMRAAQGRTADLDRYVETALASTNRATALTHRLLAFSRRQTLDPKTADLNTLIAGMTDLYRRTVGPSIQIETELADGLWPTLCDPNQLDNALLNLVINARDAMPDGGHLLIRTANADLNGVRATPGDGFPDPVSGGEYVTVTVDDTGTGMVPEVLGRAFDPFFTTKPLGQGTGLGLSMTHGFVQQSGGQVYLRSAPGQGTTVSIYLPRYLGAMDEAAQAATMAGTPARSSGSVVLLVEDEAPLRMIIVDVLSDLGFTVLEAGDGRSGLRIVESGVRIDLMVTDVGLPGGMNGRQLADVAQQRRPDLKVLFITGYAEGAMVGKSLLDRGMQVMTKPFAVEAFAARVQGMVVH